MADERDSEDFRGLCGARAGDWVRNRKIGTRNQALGAPHSRCPARVCVHFGTPPQRRRRLRRPHIDTADYDVYDRLPNPMAASRAHAWFFPVPRQSAVAGGKRACAARAAAALGCLAAFSTSCVHGSVPVALPPALPPQATAAPSRTPARLVTGLADGLVAIHAQGETLLQVVDALTDEMAVVIRLSPELMPLPVQLVLEEVTIERALNELLAAAGVTDYIWIYERTAGAPEPGAWVSVRRARTGAPSAPALFFSDLRQRAESASAASGGPAMEWTIRWRAYAASAADLVNPAEAVPLGRFDLVAQRSMPADAVVRERNPEISEDQLILVAVDSDGRPLLWRAILDPRVVRAEGMSATGEMTGRVLHRADVEFAIALPLGSAAAELQIFTPRFTGTDWVLTRLGSVQRPPQ